jgi:hypothetical protein
VVVGSGNRVYVEFNTVTDRTYWIQYRDDATAAWQTSPMSVNGTGTSIHWLDDGWPMTSGTPTAARTYRLIYTTGVATPLVIQTQPAATSVAAGGAANHEITMAAGGPYTFQWYRDGVALPGATRASYAVSRATVVDEGDYLVTVSDGRTMVTSQTAAITLASANPGRIVNLAVRAQLEGSDKPLVAGFFITGAGSRPFLLRAVGETLQKLGVTAAVRDPSLSLFQGGNLLAENDDWASDATVALTRSATASSGAFALAEQSKDAALVRRLPSAGYTLKVGAGASGSGIALVEVYDPAEKYDGGNRIANVSARAEVTGGDGSLIAGLVIGGETTCRLLVRGIGPTLTSLGVSGALPDPVLTLYAADGAGVLATNDDWAANREIVTGESLFRRVGAFDLPAGSKDAVLVVRVKPGAYTVVLSAKNAERGTALIEAYLLN